MDEIRAFYDDMFPHAEDALAYIDSFDYTQPLPEDAANLRNLLFSLITVSLAVELWNQPRVSRTPPRQSSRGRADRMGASVTDLDIVDQTPRIGSEIRVDLDTLLTGDVAEGIRTTLEERGVVFFPRAAHER